jgi:putative aldouronate transport system permease protein
MMAEVRMSAKRRSKGIRKENLALYVMALPAAIWLFIFCYIPMGGLIIAFQKFNNTLGIFGSDFVGFDNFKFLFASSDAWLITRNTVLYNLVFIVVNMLLALCISMMLSMLRNQRGAKALQTVFMMPYFLSYAVINIVVFAFLDRSNGMANAVMKALGLASNTNWYQKVSLWPGLLVGLNAWRGVGFQTVLFLAVISGINKDFYEAAMLDGATKFQQARYVTLPHLRFVASISIIMAMANIFRADFGLFYVVTRNTGTLYPVTQVIDSYIYNGLTKMSNIGMTAAAGMYQSVVGLILVLVVNWIVTKIDPDSAMF